MCGNSKDLRTYKNICGIRVHIPTMKPLDN